MFNRVKRYLNLERCAFLRDQIALINKVLKYSFFNKLNMGILITDP